MDFKSTAVIKHPLAITWDTMRDQLPEIAALLADIKSITVRERQELQAGVVRLVNLWQAAPELPALVAKHLKPEMLSWLDYAEWHPENRECRWTIEPQFYKEYLRCQGITKFEPALGGRGTKITFSGSVALETKRLAGNATWLAGMAAGMAEPFVQKMIPNNFMKLSKALAEFLDQKA